MSVHVTCESRNVYKGDPSSETGGVCLTDDERGYSTDEEVEDGHVDDVEEPVS